MQWMVPFVDRMEAVQTTMQTDRVVDIDCGTKVTRAHANARHMHAAVCLMLGLRRTTLILPHATRGPFLDPGRRQHRVLAHRGGEWLLLGAAPRCSVPQPRPNNTEPRGAQVNRLRASAVLETIKEYGTSYDQVGLVAERRELTLPARHAHTSTLTHTPPGAADVDISENSSRGEPVLQPSHAPRGVHRPV